MSISQQTQETQAWEREEYGDLASAEAQGTYCWFCGERLEDENYAETTVVVDERLMWVPVCDNCGPPTLPPPMAARLACPVCDEVLTPPRRHSCGGAAQPNSVEHVSNGRRQ
jgi:hypothetical protein